MKQFGVYQHVVCCSSHQKLWSVIINKGSEYAFWNMWRKVPCFFFILMTRDAIYLSGTALFSSVSILAFYKPVIQLWLCDRYKYFLLVTLIQLDCVLRHMQPVLHEKIILRKGNGKDSDIIEGLLVFWLSFLGFIFIYFFIFHFITGAIPSRSLSWDEILRISLSLFNVNWFIVITRSSWVELSFPDEFILAFKMDEKMRSQCDFLEKSDVNRKKLISLRNGILRGLK